MPGEAGQRFSKFLEKYFKEAPKGFIYKMLRKKNITLNGKKADGTEKLQPGDEITFWLADETITKFAGTKTFCRDSKNAASIRMFLSTSDEQSDKAC